MLCGCSKSNNVPKIDDRNRPSVSGILQVKDGKLCDEKDNPVMLRGASINDIMVSERYINNEAFSDLSHLGINVIRLAMYTRGMGSMGYCTGGEKERLKTDMDNGINYAKDNDMYAIIDWHILDDGDPNTYIEDSKEFFDEMSNKYKDYNNVIYEICNEPNKVDWPTIKKYAEVIIPIIRNNDPDSVIIVGTPNYSQDVDIAAEDPLDFDNILYTLHFYSATHKQELRDKAQIALNKGLPIFVTEYGVTSSNGSFPVDTDEADVWVDFLESNNISYVMWQYSRVAEASAMISRQCDKTSGFEYDDFTDAGKWLIDTISKHE